MERRGTRGVGEWLHVVHLENMPAKTFQTDVTIWQSASEFDGRHVMGPRKVRAGFAIDQSRLACSFKTFPCL